MANRDFGERRNGKRKKAHIVSVKIMSCINIQSRISTCSGCLNIKFYSIIYIFYKTFSISLGI